MLSTGEKQRVKLVRCILQDKPIWLLDEGTANVDEHCELEMLHILREIQKRKRKSVIHITHNRDLIRFCDYLLRIRNEMVTIKRICRNPGAT